MANTKANKEKKNKVLSEESGSKYESLKDDSTMPFKGDENKSKKKKDEQDSSKLVDAPPLPTESKGTDIQQDFPTIEKEKKKEDGIQRPSKWHPDEIHCDQLCLNCLKINYYWPPRLRPPTPPDKDPNLIYPGDADLYFKPARGDILIIHPRGLGLDPKPSPEELWWKSKRIGGGFCICFDGDKNFKFEEGDLILRIGSYVEGELKAELENEEQPLEGNNKTLKGKKTPKPKKIADPLELDPVTYKPYDKIELYRCSGFEITAEDEPLDEDTLEAELKRVFETNTNYEFSLGKSTNLDEHKKSLRESQQAGDPIVSGNLKQNPILILDNPGKNNHLKIQDLLQVKGVETNEHKLLEPSADAENKINSKAEELARNYIASRDLQKSKGSPQDLELQHLDTKKKAPNNEKQPSVTLIWTFLGSQAKLCVGDNVAPITDPKCPGLGCFYHPHFNLGNHCKKQEHTHVPNLGDILIPEGVWFKKFNHRKNERRSMVEWYVPLGPSLQIHLEGEASLIGDLAEEEKASSPEIDQGKKNSSKKKGEKDKDKKGGGKSKTGKGNVNDQEETEKNAGFSNKESGLVRASLGGTKGRVGKGKEIVQYDEFSNEPSNKGNKAVQVPQDLEQVPNNEDLDAQVMPWNNEPNLGTIVLCPLVGRKFKDEQSPVEEWKWPRKNKIWGSVEMYMVEQGIEDLDWVFWGKSDRICDTSYPLPQPGAKPKFLHPRDAKVEIPRNNQDLGEEPPLSKEDQTNELPQVDSSKGGGRAETSDVAGGKNTKTEKKMKTKDK